MRAKSLTPADGGGRQQHRTQVRVASGPGTSTSAPVRASGTSTHKRSFESQCVVSPLRGQHHIGIGHCTCTSVVVSMLPLNFQLNRRWLGTRAVYKGTSALAHNNMFPMRFTRLDGSLLGPLRLQSCTHDPSKTLTCLLMAGEVTRPAVHRN